MLNSDHVRTDPTSAAFIPPAGKSQCVCVRMCVCVCELARSTTSVTPGFCPCFPVVEDRDT